MHRMMVVLSMSVVVLGTALYFTALSALKLLLLCTYIHTYAHLD